MSKPDGALGSVAIPKDDMKSASASDINISHQHSDNRVQLRKGKGVRSAHYRQSLPLSVDTVKVISHGSPPASPDLKFTRIAKRTWRSPRKMIDDLSSSASTGNVIDDISTHELRGAMTESLHSFQSNDSISLDRSSFSQKYQKTPILSPLVAVSTSTPLSGESTDTGTSQSSQEKILPRNTSAAARDVEKLTPGQSPSPANVRWSKVAAGNGVNSSSASHEQLLKIASSLKRGQLDVVRRATGGGRSPISSFVLDSNLLDVSSARFMSFFPKCIQ